jgi:hypothetical protein
MWRHFRSRCHWPRRHVCFHQLTVTSLLAVKCHLYHLRHHQPVAASHQTKHTSVACLHKCGNLQTPEPTRSIESTDRYNNCSSCDYILLLLAGEINSLFCCLRVYWTTLTIVMFMESFTNYLFNTDYRWNDNERDNSSYCQRRASQCHSAPPITKTGLEIHPWTKPATNSLWYDKTSNCYHSEAQWWLEVPPRW